MQTAVGRDTSSSFLQITDTSRQNTDILTQKDK